MCQKDLVHLLLRKTSAPTAVLLHCPFQFWAWVHVSALSLLMYVPIWLVGGPIPNSTNNYAFFSNFILGNYPWKHPFQEKKNWLELTTKYQYFTSSKVILLFYVWCTMHSCLGWKLASLWCRRTQWAKIRKKQKCNLGQLHCHIRRATQF